jgi:pimeloyl-ACP methyl ester carboxylesterase
VQVRLSDGYGMFVEEVGGGFPLVVLHGGPGLDHTHFRPWLDPLGDDFRLLYVDERGQGKSERVDSETLSLEVFARDVDLLAEALGLDRFALLGHSFGAIVATGEQGAAIAETWEREQTVESEAELKELLAAQMPFHFHGEVPPGYADETVGSPEVLRHFARIGYGDFDYRPRLQNVRRPTLVVVGEHDRTTTPRAARVLHDGIDGSELVVVPNAGHMSFVEDQQRYLDAVRGFLRAVSAA